MGESFETRFWTRVDCSGGPSACWPWMLKSQDKDGYGLWFIARDDQPARPWRCNRLALEFALRRPLGDGMQALHRCDNPRCCNPAHLFEGTCADNMADKVTKGRQSRGDLHWSRTMPERLARGDRHGKRTKPERTARHERHGRARLTMDDVRKIRSAYASGGETYDSLARVHGVGRTTIAHILLGHTWREAA